MVSTRQPEARAGNKASLDRVVSLAALVLVAAVLVPALVSFLQHSWEIIWFPWQIDFDEGVNVNASWLLAQGHNIYAPYSPERFVSSLYPPLFFGINAIALKIWGLNLWSGRLLSFAGALAVGAGLWFWVWAATRRHAGGLVAALLWFSLGPVLVWSTFYKQDVPAIALGLLGLALLAYTWPRPGRQRMAYWAAAFVVLSVWMKQSSVAPLAAAALFLLLQNHRFALRWLLVVAVAGFILPLVLLQTLTGGLIEHLLGFNEFGRSVPRLIQRSSRLVSEFWPVLLAGAIFLALCIRAFARERGRAARLRSVPLSAIYLLVSIPATVLALLHPTGNFNQLLNILAPLCLAAGLLLSEAWARMEQGQGAAARAIALAVAALVLVQAALVYGQPSRIWYSSLGISLPERADRMEKISELIRQTPGDVLSEDNWLVLRNGKRVIYDDPAGMAALARSGKWDESVLLQEIGGRAFPMVVLDYDITDLDFTYRWSDAALRALRDNYDLLYADVRFIHIPKPVEAEPLAQADCRAVGGPGLQGFTFRPTDARPGNVFGLGLYWQRDGTTEVDGNIKVSARLVDEAGGVRWQADWPPGETAGKAWSAAWAPGQTIVDTVQVPLSYDIPYGKYRLDLVAYTLNAEGNLAPVEFDCTFPRDIGAAGGLRLAEFQLVERR